MTDTEGENDETQADSQERALRSDHEQPQQGDHSGDAPGCRDRRQADSGTDASDPGSAVDRLHGSGVDERGAEPQGVDGQFVQPDLTGHLVYEETTLRRSGPLPDPGELAGYGRVQDDFPERIMRMAEQNQAAQIKAAATASDAEAWALRVAAVAVTLLPWFFGVLTVVLAVMDQPVAAILGVLVTAFSAGPQVISAIRNRSAADESEGSVGGSP